MNVLCKVAVVFVTMASASVAKAELITHLFSGEVVFTSGVFTEYQSESASGYFLYDTNWTSSGIVPVGSGERESYLADTDNWSFVLTVGDFAFDSSPDNASSLPQLVVQNNGTFTDPDSNLVFDEFSYFNNTDEGFIWQVGLSEFLIQPEVPDAFSSTDIPIDLMLDDFNTRFALIRGEGSELRVNLESLTRVAIPEPSTLAQSSFGLLGLVLVRRRKRA